MFLKQLSVCAFMFCMLFLSIEGQVCNRRAVVTLTVREPYTYTYREQYQTKCWYGGTCTKTRVRSNVGYRVATKREVKLIEVCCEGYMRIDSNIDDEIIDCQPICMPSCANGYCESPGYCTCNEGYVLDPSNPHNCLPHCEKDCGHGTCVEPNTCECSFGNSIVNGTCTPICEEPCENGKCTAPDTCECYDGFRKAENNSCLPYCSKGCGRGKCVQPEICGCEEGYTFEGEECIPHCSNDCGNGTCIAPETCECDPGYTNSNDTCQPICPEPCINGYCSAPFTCSCNPGYIYQWGNCRPYCSNECGIGKCVAPEVCECESGFRLTNSCDPYCCEAVCSKPCIHGSCVEPELCDCDDGYKKDFALDTCVPDCIFDCGNGTCIEPNTCECHPGYKEKENRADYDEPVCEPECKNCEGTCVRPHTCECGSMFLKKDEDVDGKDCDCFTNCLDKSRQCERTLCLYMSTTESTTNFIKEQVTFDYDGLTVQSDLIDFNFDEFETVLATDESYIEPTFTESNTVMPTVSPDSTFTTKTEHIFVNTTGHLYRERRFPVWAYVVIGIVLIIVAFTLVILVIKRNTVMQFLSGASYEVEDKADDTRLTSQSIDMRFSTIEKNRGESFR